ncbi:MAG TPA: rhodanese-like domain-containing protein [Vicinamibacterales bacterium]|jgi:hydroxyacylglutathione hydrolase|nr:rhodanese-like domain-containing protein [Vicinamibacterales bacterium]
MFQRFFDEGLAQASFLIGCDRSKQAVVIDPRRDASIYAAAAQQSGVRIVAAIETHVHADFVSGARELAQKGARVICGPGSGLRFDHHEVRDSERLSIGDAALTFLHTPGHTPEHICILAESPGHPTRLFTGDLLFVGAVGRPDLLGDAQTRQLAGDLFGSLQRVMTLDDGVEVHPGHGAGSLCGAGIGQEPSSTIARERQQNALLQYQDRGAFVSAVLADIPETPPYFARMKRINAEGPPLLGLVDGTIRIPSIRPGAAAALTADGAMIVDLRRGDAFAAGHPYGAVNIGYGAKVGYWAGWVIDADTPVILLADEPTHAQEAAVQLLRVGLDRIEGAIAGGYDAWIGAGLPTATLEQIDASDLRDSPARQSMRIVDVRTPHEWRAGHLEGSINIPVGEIPARARELAGDAAVATICEGGYRSTLAASLLAHEGVAHIVNITGGMAAYRSMETA